MADIAALGIKIDSRDVKNASLDLVELEKSSQKANASVASLEKSAFNLSGAVAKLAAAFAGLKMADYTRDVAMAGARYETLGVVMTQVGQTAGYTRKQMDEFATGLQKSGISMTESRESLSRLVQAHVDLTNSSKLARVAQDAAVIGNINSSEAFGRLVYGIQSAQVEVLRTMGLNVNFETSYKKLAEQLGKTTASLTEKEKTIARVNVVMEAGKTITGAYEAAMGTAGKQITSFKRYVEDFEVQMGTAFGPATLTLVDAATKAMKQFQEEIQRPDVQKTLKDVSSSLADVMAKVGKELPGAIEKTSDAIKTLKTVYDAIPGDVLLGGGIVGSALLGNWGYAAILTIAGLGPTISKILSVADKVPGKGYGEQRFPMPNDPGKPDSWLTTGNEKAAAIARAQKELDFAIVTGTEKASKAARSYFNTIDDVFGEAPQSALTAFDKIRDEWEKMTLSAHSYTVLNIAQWFEKEALALGGEHEMLVAIRQERERIANIVEAKRLADRELVYMPAGYNSDSFIGMKAADERSKKMIEEAKKHNNQLVTLSEHAAKAMEKNFSDFYFDTITGKLSSLADFWEGILNSLARMTSDILGQITREMIFGVQGGGSSLASQIAGVFTSGSSTGGDFGVTNAMGGVYSGRGISAYSNRVVSQPTVFPFARGIGLMGEAGAEAIMPLTRMPGGSLGVKATTTAQPSVTVNIQNNTGGQIKEPPKISFDLQGMILDIVLDGVDRNVNDFGSRMGVR